MKTFKLHLIRHGLTQGNADGVYVGGGLDLPLCEAGEQQVRELDAMFEYPGVGIVFSSPMLRALQTADIIYPQVENRLILEDLRECRFGEFEGKSASELANNKNFTKWMDPQSGYVPEGGESGQAFAERTARALLVMLHQMVQEGVSHAACITHGGVIMSMLSQKALPRKNYNEWMTDNGCGFTVQASTAMLMRDELVEALEIIPRGYMD